MTDWGALALLILNLQGGAMAQDGGVDSWAALEGRHFDLVTLDGAPLGTEAALEFLPGGMIRGQAPCNGFGAGQLAEWPGFALGPVRATKRACPALAAEQTFLSRLSDMQTARFEAGRLVLSDPGGGQMVFAPQPR
jgi:heat shock protein HslJ